MDKKQVGTIEIAFTPGLLISCRTMRTFMDPMLDKNFECGRTYVSMLWDDQEKKSSDQNRRDDAYQHQETDGDTTGDGVSL